MYVVPVNFYGNFLFLSEDFHFFLQIAVTDFGFLYVTQSSMMPLHVHKQTKCYEKRQSVN